MRRLRRHCSSARPRDASRASPRKIPEPRDGSDRGQGIERHVADLNQLVPNAPGWFPIDDPETPLAARHPIAAGERHGSRRHLGGDVERCDAAELVLPLALDRLWAAFAIPGRDTAITAVHTALSARGYTPKNVSFAGLMRTTNARHVLRSMHQPAGPPSDPRMALFAGYYCDLVRT